MEWLKGIVCLPEVMKKYRWALVVLLAGLFLLALPGGGDVPAEIPEETASREESLQQQLEEILGQLAGAGKVRVLLTQSTGERTHFQTDEESTRRQDSTEIRQETVLTTDGSRQEIPLICRVDPPVYLGAVVLCQGADSASVRLAVVEAVGTATGLTADKITVLKMK